MKHNQAREEDELVSRLLREFDRVPPAPDCRAAVAAKIAGPARRRLRWSYSFASLTLAAVIAAGFLAMPSRQARDQKPATARVERVSPAPAYAPPAQENAGRTAEKPAVHTAAASADARPVRSAAEPPPPRAKRAPQQAKKPAADRPDDTAAAQVRAQPEPAGPPADFPSDLPGDEPLALVIAQWPMDPEQEDTVYAYTERDPDTGQTVSCEVSRSGNSVTIRLEARDEGEDSPQKGCVTDDTIPSA